MAAMPPESLTPREHVLTGLSNAEFFNNYAKAGRIGLSSGLTLIDRLRIWGHSLTSPQTVAERISSELSMDQKGCNNPPARR